MQFFTRMVFPFTLLIVLASTVVWAQPPEVGRTGRGERGGGMMAMRSVPIEQILSFLAFDDKVAVSNEQLGKIRDELKVIHAQRAQLLGQLRENQDREAAMMEIRKLRRQMTQKLTGVLNAQQVEILSTYMQNMAQRGDRGDRGGQGRRDRGGNDGQ